MKIEQLREEALNNKIPIMHDDGIKFLCNFIIENDITSVLEIGSAVGYSAICMKLAKPSLSITTIEKDETRYKEAIKNINAFQVDIECLNVDGLSYTPTQSYDLLFIDAAKTKNGTFLERFDPFTKKWIIIDDISMYGLVDSNEQIKNRNLRKLTEKIAIFKHQILSDERYSSKYYEIGNGIIVARKN